MHRPYLILRPRKRREINSGKTHKVKMPLRQKPPNLRRVPPKRKTYLCQSVVRVQQMRVKRVPKR